MLGVDEEGDAVRAGDVASVGIGGEDGFDDVEVAEHGGGVEVEAGAVGEEEFGDVAAAHVGGGAKAGFEVAATPVPGRIDEGGRFGEEGLNSGEVGMGDADEGLDFIGGESGWAIGHGRLLGRVSV